MSGTNSTTAEATLRKANKQKFGQMGAPITGVARVLRKAQDASKFQGKTDVSSWVIITTDGKLIKATTYDGNLGDRFNLGDHNTQPLPAADSKDYRRATKGYSEVSVSECPVVATETEQA